MAPEVWRGDYDEKCDIWSIGCILYMILATTYPFMGETEEETKEMIKEGIFNKRKSGYK